MLTVKQKARIAKINPAMGVFLMTEKITKEFQRKIKIMEIEFSQKLEAAKQHFFANAKQVQKGEKGIDGLGGRDGKDGKPGQDGKTPTKQEILDIVELFVPRETSQDIIIQRVLAQLKLTKIPTVEEILNKIHETKLSVNDIEGLDNRLITINRNIGTVKQRKDKGGGGGGGGVGNPTSFSFTGDASTTEFTLSTDVAANGLAIWAYYNGQWLQPGVHFSVSGKILTTTFTPESGVIIEGFYFRT